MFYFVTYLTGTETYHFPTSFLIDDKGDIVKVYQGAHYPAAVEQDFLHIPQTSPSGSAGRCLFPVSRPHIALGETICHSVQHS